MDIKREIQEMVISALGEICGFEKYNVAKCFFVQDFSHVGKSLILQSASFT